MSTGTEASEFRFEKRRAEAIVHLSTGESIGGCFFLAGGVTYHDGAQRIGELLNADAGFFPFEVHDASGERTVLCHRAHVVTVVLADNEAKAVAGYDVATRRVVSIVLTTGERVTGAIRVYRPEGRDRLSDWTRQPEIFRYLETADQTLVINTNHIVAVSEVPES